MHTLPNGLTIHHHRAYETDFVYREVFIDQIYTRPFSDLPANPCVIDVGANIGLFSLFIKQQFPAARVYAFEPAPSHFELLTKNLSEHTGVSLYQQGLGKTAGRERFTYYPNYSLLSGFHGDAKQDGELLRAGIAQLLPASPEQPAADREKYIALLADDKLDHAEQFLCEITTLATLIAQEKIPTIDLLKIDAEKAELEVLQGIDTASWGKIQRIVLEAHNSETCAAVCALLEKNGYRVNTQKTADFNASAIYTVYAQRLTHHGISQPLNPNE